MPSSPKLRVSPRIRAWPAQLAAWRGHRQAGLSCATVHSLDRSSEHSSGPGLIGLKRRIKRRWRAAWTQRRARG